MYVCLNVYLHCTSCLHFCETDAAAFYLNFSYTLAYIQTAIAVIHTYIHTNVHILVHT